jgi:hypothetical protein
LIHLALARGAAAKTAAAASNATHQLTLSIMSASNL